MMPSLRAAVALLLCAGLTQAADYSVKTEKADAPADIPEAARKLLGDQVIRFSDGKDKLLAELWFRKEIPAKATDAQIGNGLTYQEIPQTTLLGAIKIHEEMNDYKKHKVKPGLYTMRLAYQPMDGDHMGTAPFAEFIIMVPVKFDEGKATLEPEMLHKLGARASGSGHPAVWLLFPVARKDLGKPPAVAKRENNHWVLTVTQDVNVDGKKTTIGIGLTLIGVSPSA
jgi:hypothetical protein